MVRPAFAQRRAAGRVPPLPFASRSARCDRTASSSVDRAVMTLVARSVQHDQVLGLLESEPSVRAVMDLQGVSHGTECAGVTGPRKGQRLHSIPVSRAQVLTVWKPPKGGDRELHLLVRRSAHLRAEAHDHRTGGWGYPGGLATIDTGSSFCTGVR